MTTEATEPSTDGRYVYCIIGSEQPRQFKTKGIGERGDAVYTMHYRDLAAVVSDSPVREYERTRHNMMAHTLVLEEAIQELAILPVRFGTVAPRAEDIPEKLLERRFAEMHALLDDMEGNVELGLKALWHERAIFDEIIEENGDIQKLRDTLINRPAAETYFERIRLGQMIEIAMAQKREEDGDRILSALRPMALRTRTNKTFTDRMILNAAFLVDKQREKEFDEAIHKLDEEMGQKVIFKYVGPVPPYNFVDIVVNWDG